MEKKKTMFRIPVDYHNAARVYGRFHIEEVGVSYGRRFITDSKGARYEIETDSVDGNGNEYRYQYDENYGPDWALYETYEAAKMIVLRKKIMEELHLETNMVFKGLSIDKLAVIRKIVNDKEEAE